MPRTLCVGSAGYLGASVVESLKLLRGDFMVYDSLFYEDQYLKSVPFIRGDIRDTEKLVKVAKDFDSIVWLAAIVGDGACAAMPDLTTEINEHCVRKATQALSDKRWIFTSTCSVYGANSAGELTEDSPTNPLSLYAGTKLSAEQYITKNCTDYFIFRLGTLFGLSDEHSRIRFDLVVNKMSADAVLKNQLTVYGGQQWRPLLYVRDLGEFIAYMAWSSERQRAGVYNLSYQNYLIKNIAASVASLSGCEIAYQEFKYEDQRDYRACSDKARTMLGFAPTTPIEVGISEIIRVVKEGRIKNVNSPKHSNQGFIESDFK